MPFCFTCQFTRWCKRAPGLDAFMQRVPGLPACLCTSCWTLIGSKFAILHAPAAGGAEQQTWQQHAASSHPAAWRARWGCPAVPSCSPAWQTGHAPPAPPAASPGLAAASARHARMSVGVHSMLLPVGYQPSYYKLCQ